MPDEIKQFYLKDDIKTYDDLTAAMGETHAKLLEMLTDMGVQIGDLQYASANIANTMKWFADNYSRLLIEGKIPKGKECKVHG